MLNITTKINNDIWSENQLDRIQRERRIVTLHEMKRLGASIKQGGRELSHDDINFLTFDELREVLLNSKVELGVDGFQKIYKDQLELADDMWRGIAKQWTPGSETLDSGFEMTIQGVSLDSAMQAIATLTHEEMLDANPEHFALTDDGESKYGAEICGMYGGPLAGIVNYEDLFGDNAPDWVEKADGFREKTGGYGKLASDGTEVHISSTIAMKPTESGFIFKSTIHWPVGTPVDMVEGHKIHLAIEYLEGFRLAEKKQAELAEIANNQEGTSYDIIAETPMGNQDGQLFLDIKGNDVSGTLIIMGKENSFADGTIDENGNLSFNGKVKAGIGKVKFSASGTLVDGQVHITLKSKIGNIVVKSK